ncbi:hypothetical protein FIU89_06990 [Roseovarius sp. THAF27]|uniref:hypothetical protein n=1 Tax=Roseovarius sp. THAF27 TaxID=2587850 RepID=UPI001267EE30|nr:hypothetical protein [Roseovarius sp. THAF27]QFT80353.1 hypothetical protein FIU89_06990 [Roseovarius sp. THAF27]
MSRGFHILRETGAVTVARRVPVRFDVSAEARFGLLRKLALAQQVRQDLWRALKNVRGFAPVVRVVEAGDGVTVTAGGQVEGRHDRARLEETVAGLLADPRHVARWTRWAR